jgi:hypothetical protein
MERAMQMLPWLFAFSTAIWFGVMAGRAGRNPVSWAVAGAVLGLVATTVVQGLGEAVFLPLSHEAIVLFRVKTIAAAFGIVGFLGWIFTLGLQRWHLGWRKKTGSRLRKERNNQDHDVRYATHSAV